MAPTRFLLGAIIMSLATLVAACGPDSTRVPPIERGTALPPPDLPQPRRP